MIIGRAGHSATDGLPGRDRERTVLVENVDGGDALPVGRHQQTSFVPAPGIAVEDAAAMGVVGARAGLGRPAAYDEDDSTASRDSVLIAAAPIPNSADPEVR